MERAKCEMRGAAAAACALGRISEQLSRESCSAMRSNTRTVVAAHRVSQSARSVRRPPCAGRR
eukprot:11223428-Lingulodinium_polyedra.AAC.1